ncbi:MAG: glycerol-3-phosphate 1-O-acyltransferase PlsY [Pseudomonadota bacterium]
MITSLIVIVAGYLLGSISSAILSCALMGLPDPRTQGSRNPGATNVLRIGGKTAAIVTLLGDMLKGLIPVGLAKLLEVDDLVVGAVALAAVIGHLYPLYFGFQGGKGVATLLGVLLGMSWQLGLVWALTWLAMAAVFRISSLSALVATSLIPLYTYWLLDSFWLVMTTAVLAILIIWRHRSNIRNLISGSETRI